jgi:hypothetical protein
MTTPTAAPSTGTTATSSGTTASGTTAPEVEVAGETRSITAPSLSTGVSLSLRASLAAHRRGADHDDPVTRAPLWRDRAARLTRLVCSILGVDPACVSAMPDPDRTYELFGHSDIRLIVADTLLDTEGASGQGLAYEFICGPDVSQPHVVDLLRPCPGCTQLVPTYRIGELGDLGRVILTELAGQAPLPPDAHRFAHDGAHRPGCTYRSPTQPRPR